jgi:hypothetical protein
MKNAHPSREMVESITAMIQNIYRTRGEAKKGDEAGVRTLLLDSLERGKWIMRVKHYYCPVVLCL